MLEINSALQTLVERGGSDLHIKVASPPTARLHGELVPLEGYGQLTPEETEKAFRDIALERSVEEFEKVGEADFSYSVEGFSRFRVNAFRQRGSISIVCRAIPFDIDTPDPVVFPPTPPNASFTQTLPILNTSTGSLVDELAFADPGSR